MAITAPTYHGTVNPAQLAANRQAQSGTITPEAAVLNTKLQQLPAYQSYVQNVLLGHQQPNAQMVNTLVQQAHAAGIDVPDSLIFDPFTGQVREKNWNESNSGWSALMYVGLTTGLGLVGGGIVGAAAGGGAGGGAAAGGTLASTTIAPTVGTLAPTVVASGAVPAAVASGGAAATGGVLASSTIAPTIGGLAPTVAASGAVPAAFAATGPPAAAAGSSWLTSPTAQLISQGIGTAGQIYGANQAANATADAARIQAQEADKALAAQQAELDYQHSQDSLKTNQYNDYLSRLNPYATTGQASSNRLSQFMGQPVSAQTPLTINPPPNPLPAQRTTIPVTTAQQAGANSWGSTADANRTAAGGSPPDPQSQSTNGMATMQAPDGSIRQVPIGDVPRLFALGARRVDDGTISQAPPPASVPPGAIRAGTPNATGSTQQRVT